jgi:hypothetical protein
LRKSRFGEQPDEGRAGDEAFGLEQATDAGLGDEGLLAVGEGVPDRLLGAVRRAVVVVFSSRPPGGYDELDSLPSAINAPGANAQSTREQPGQLQIKVVASPRNQSFQ